MTQSIATQESLSLDAGTQEVIAIHERAWNNHDPKLLMTLFADDEIDFVNVLGIHHRNTNSLEREIQHLHSTIMRDSQVRMRSHTARLLTPDSAVAHVHWEMTGVEKVPGWNISDPRRGILTYVLVRRDGKWKVTAATNTEVIDLALPK